MTTPPIPPKPPQDPERLTLVHNDPEGIMPDDLMEDWPDPKPSGFLAQLVRGLLIVAVMMPIMAGSIWLTAKILDSLPGR